jgi:hypothetical protein
MNLGVASGEEIGLRQSMCSPPWARLGDWVLRLLRSNATAPSLSGCPSFNVDACSDRSPDSDAKPGQASTVILHFQQGVGCMMKQEPLRVIGCHVSTGNNNHKESVITWWLVKIIARLKTRVKLNHFHSRKHHQTHQVKGQNRSHHFDLLLHRRQIEHPKRDQEEWQIADQEDQPRRTGAPPGVVSGQGIGLVQQDFHEDAENRSCHGEQQPVRHPQNF